MPCCTKWWEIFDTENGEAFDNVLFTSLSAINKVKQGWEVNVFEHSIQQTYHQEPSFPISAILDKKWPMHNTVYY